MDLMSEDALMRLWEAQQRAQRFVNEYWKLSDQLMDDGLVRIEDIAEIWGIHPSTARERIKSWRKHAALFHEKAR